MLQKDKSGERIPMDSVYGSKCLLHVTNIVLFGTVIILAIVSFCIYYLLPVVDVTKLTKKNDIPGANKIDLDAVSVDIGPDTEEEPEDEFYNIISTRNVFSPQRKDWVVKAVIPKGSGFTKKHQVKKKAFGGKPKKFVLHGVLIAGDIKKALINNPLKGIRKEKTLYVEEGEKLDGYEVTSIEKDRIKLDWHGEEIVVLLYNGPRNSDQKDVGNKKPRKSMKKLKVNKADISLKNQNEDERSLVASVVGVKGNMNGGSSNEENVFNDTLFNPLSMAYEPFYMPGKDGAKISVQDEAYEGEEIIPELDVVDAKYSEEEREVAMVGPADSIYKVLEEEELKQKALSIVPTQIILKGIVIAGNIKKALVNVPMSKERENRSLYVEEGDGLEGYLITKIEPVQIRLDWQGEEIILTFPNLY